MLSMANMGPGCNVTCPVERELSSQGRMRNTWSAAAGLCELDRTTRMKASPCGSTSTAGATIFPGGFHPVNRDKNLPHITDLGLKLAVVERIVARLTTSDYSQGPLPDDRGTGEQVWVFGPQFEREQLYVKLTLRKGGVDCASVHRAERPLHLPFKVTGREV